MRLGALDLAGAGTSTPAAFLGAQVTGNQLLGCTWSVVTNSDFNFTAELSVDGVGNDWGLTCVALLPLELACRP